MLGSAPHEHTSNAYLGARAHMRLRGSMRVSAHTRECERRRKYTYKRSCARAHRAQMLPRARAASVCARAFQASLAQRLRAFQMNPARPPGDWLVDAPGFDTETYACDENVIPLHHAVCVTVWHSTRQRSMFEFKYMDVGAFMPAYTRMGAYASTCASARECAGARVHACARMEACASMCARVHFRRAQTRAHAQTRTTARAWPHVRAGNCEERHSSARAGLTQTPLVPERPRVTGMEGFYGTASLHALLLKSPRRDHRC